MEFENFGDYCQSRTLNETFNIYFEDLNEHQPKYTAEEIKSFDEKQKKEYDEHKKNLLVYLETKKNLVSKNIIAFDKEPLSTGFYSDYFVYKYKDTFLYSNNKLYRYTGIYWKVDQNKSMINNFIDNTFYKDIQKEISKYNDYNQERMRNTKDKQELWDNVIKYRKQAEKLRSNNFRKDLIKDIEHKLNNNDIKFDEIPHLFCFNNKLFDLKENKFIDSKPEYYISLTTNYNYIEEPEEEQKQKREELENIIGTILQNESHRKLYLTLLSTSLIGEVLDKFIVISGAGGNGKSVMNELTQTMMGDYFYLIPNDILINASKGSGPSPEKANLHNKRLTIAREPPTKDSNSDKLITINCSFIKELTGNSSINARLCNSNDTNVLIKTTLIIEMNKKPALSESTEAMLRRLIDIPFKSSFYEEHKLNELKQLNIYDEKNHFLRNKFYTSNEFKEKYKITIFNLLKDYVYDYYKNNKNIELDEEIIERNKLYLQSSDCFYIWFKENYKITKEANIIYMKDLFKDFKNGEYYLNTSKADKKNLSYKKFVEEFENNLFLKLFITKDKDKTYIIINHTKVDSEPETKPIQLIQPIKVNPNKVLNKYNSLDLDQMSETEEAINSDNEDEEEAEKVKKFLKRQK